MEVTNVAIRRGRGEGKGVAPEVPLEDADGVARCDDPDEMECILAAREPRVEEGWKRKATRLLRYVNFPVVDGRTYPRDHEQHKRTANDNERHVTTVEPVRG
jgi:hypothetical protein